MSKRHRRQLAARKGWRRRRAAGYVPAGRQVGHRRERGEALALAYRVQQIDRARFERLFVELRGRQGILPSARAAETLWREYEACWRLYRVRGQDFRTTNGQRARAHALSGRPRSPRTIQRAHATLAQMGLLRRYHVRRGGARVGARDCLRVSLRTLSFDTPPSAAGPTALRAEYGPAPATECRQKVAPGEGLIAPPTGGRGDRAAPSAADGSDEREEPHRGSDASPDRPAEPVRPARARLEELLRDGRARGFRPRRRE